MSLIRWTVLLLLGLAACDGASRDDDDDAVGDVEDGDEREVEDDDDDDAPGTAPVRRHPDGVPVPHPRRGTEPAPDDGGEGTGDGGTGDDEHAEAPVERTPAAPGSRAPKPISPMPQGIVKVSDTRWTVTQALVDRWMKSTSQVGNVREAGEGWAVMGVRTRAAYHLGMRNGDVIMEVNGHKLDTKTQLLGAYLDLKNDKTFDVILYRDGVRRVHHYQIVN